jgi:ketosteroid isomerase-like protein
MRSFILAALITLPMLVATPCAAQFPQEALPPDVRAALERIPDAWAERALAADWEGVAQLYHEQAVLMPMDAPAVAGRDAIRQTFALLLGREGGVALDHLSFEVREAEAAGELVYVGAGYRQAGTLTVDGITVPFEQRGSYVNILRRDEAGAWRIYRQIINRDHPLPDPGT